MKTHLALLSFALVAVLPACGRTETTQVAPPKAGGTASPSGDEHGDPIALGKMTIGAHTFDVVQLGKMEAGKEGVVELHFAADKPLPATARAWVGDESGEGARKQRFGKEGDHGLHAHLDVRKDLTAQHKLWIEIEENGATARGSVAWQ
jgi:hypothetical protein